MSEMKKVYLIPGLGATAEAFDKLDFGNCERIAIAWLKPSKKDDIPSYAKKLVEQIKDPENAILCGLSFGGIIAVELAKLLPVHKTIIISSVKTRREFPNTIRLAKFLPVHKLVKADTVRKFNFWYWWAFGKTSETDKKLIRKMVDVMDAPFTDWCAHQAVDWSNKTIPENLFHIHGTGDRIFPSYKVKNYYKVKGGTHFMIVNRAKEINDYLKDILSDKLVSNSKPISKSSKRRKKNEKV